MAGKGKNNFLHHEATLVADVVYEETKHEKALLSPQEQKKKIAHEIEKHVQKAQKKIQQGIEYCVQVIHDTKILDEVNKTVVAPLSKHATEDALFQDGQKLLDNVTWKEQLGISQSLMQHLYNAAKFHFDHDDMKKAECVYFFLTTLDPKEYSFWVGLGHASTKQHHFEQAINAYAMASMLKSNDPWPHIWAGNALFLHKDKEKAKMAYESAQALAGKDYKLQRMIQENIVKCIHK